MHSVWKSLGFTLLLSLLSGCIDLPYTNIDNEELKALLRQGVPIVDIRRPDEWRQTGIIEGSDRLTFIDGRGQVPASFIPQFTRRYPKDQPVIVICRTGNRTQSLAKHLANEQGYTKVYNVYDGITAWLGARNPIVR